MDAVVHNDSIWHAQKSVKSEASSSSVPIWRGHGRVKGGFLDRFSWGIEGKSPGKELWGRALGKLGGAIAVVSKVVAAPFNGSQLEWPNLLRIPFCDP